MDRGLGKKKKRYREGRIEKKDESLKKIEEQREADLKAEGKNLQGERSVEQK